MAVPTKSSTVQSTVLYDYAHATYSTKNNDIGTEIVQVLASKSLQHPCTVQNYGYKKTSHVL